MTIESNRRGGIAGVNTGEIRAESSARYSPFPNEDTGRITIGGTTRRVNTVERNQAAATIQWLTRQEKLKANENGESAPQSAFQATFSPARLEQMNAAAGGLDPQRHTTIHELFDRQRK